MCPGGACTACPGFSLVHRRHSPGGTLYHRAARGTPPQRRTEGAQSHATGQGYRGTATPPGRCTERTEPPQRARATAPEKGNRRKGHLQPHRTTPRRRGYSYTTPGIKAATEPHSGAQRATPPGVQSRPERHRPCPGLLYHAKALIEQPGFVQIFVPFR